MHNRGRRYRRGHGGRGRQRRKIIFPKFEIPTVGWIAKIEDPEGNILCMKQAAPEHSQS